MATLHRLIETVLAGYLSAKAGPPKGHPIGVILRRELPDAVRVALDEVGMTGKMTVKGSAGQGKWASIPWVAIFHPKQTTSAQRGVFVVYLFASDMSRIYLTLNQGVSEISVNDLVTNRENIRLAVGAVGS